ncbi:MAG: arsenic resistance N-acetyltransferase ArsN2 [Longimicrobiales bacterium]|nr:arsenic resistance N-acetyltransferase ArsN2 [Longimicrobiales bacterium]
MTLRPAMESDLPAVLTLLADSGLPSAGVEESFGSFVVAETEGRLVGVAGLEIHGPDGVLRSVAVMPAYQGAGLGGRLTERSLDAARERGLRRVYLLTTTAEEFFPRFGFRRIDRSDASPDVQESVEFREACPTSAVAMVREL